MRTVTKPCEACAVIFTRVVYGNDKDPRFCSQKCANHNGRRASAEKRKAALAKREAKRAAKQTVKRVYANQRMSAHNRQMTQAGQADAQWTPNGHPLCAGGAHWSEEVERQGVRSLFRCKLCGATRWYSNAPVELHPWRPRMSAELELVEAF